MTAKHRPQNHGFSLVELSIVLVILGLLTGGILTGQSLIRASELRAVTTEYQRFMAASQTFRDKYFAIPGDMTNATSFGTGWIGVGDGDGQVETTGTATSNEISLFWIHLSQAGLIEGSYTNVANTTFTIGTNNPRSKLSQSGWNVLTLGNVAITSTTYYPANYGNAFFFGTGTTVGTPGGALKSEEAWNIDTKMDDGRPDAGGVLTLESQGNATAGSGCGNIAAAATALAASAYDLTNTSATACSLVMKTSF
jgi:prepilin-type N-terminal cleavage/methylation domain-containing protein